MRTVNNRSKLGKIWGFHGDENSSRGLLD